MDRLFSLVLTRLTVFLFVPLVVLVFLLTGDARELSRSRQIRELQRQAEAAAAWFRKDPERAALADDVDYVKICRELADSHHARALILETDGRVLGDSRFGSYRLKNPENRAELAIALQARAAAAHRRDATLDSDFLHVSVPLRQDGEIVGVLSLSRPWGAAGATVRTFFQDSLVPLLVLLAFLGVAAYSVSRHLGGWVHDLTIKTARLGDLPFDPERRSDDPLQTLTAVINENHEQLQQRLDETLAENRRWDLLFTSMREGFLAVTRDWQITACNRAAAALLGLPAHHELVGHPLTDVVRNADLQGFFRGLMDSDEDFLEAEIELQGQEFATFLRLSGVRLHGQNGASVGATVVLHDISHLKRLERVRSEFVANVSHELKTPLTAISGFLDPLGECLTERPDQAREFLDVVARHTVRMNAIIDDLLSLSRLEQDESRLRHDFQRLDLRETIRHAVKLCQAKTAASKVTIELDLERFVLTASHRLLEQAIVNLLDNAIKYSPEGGVVEVALAAVEGGVEIRVKDEGAGIARQHHERIFERFYRVDKARDRKTGGTGLGLSIVKHVVRLHGGTIGVESELGKGAAFSIFLPLPPVNDNGAVA